MIIKEIPSPNFNERKDGKKPQFLILHYTELETVEESLEYLTGKKGLEVSAHYLLEEDGTVIRLVDENMRAWHAGKSYWHGERDLNSTSIGIEIQNNGTAPFPQKQIKTLIKLSKEIMHRHNIKPHNVLAHSDIAPERKIDPGALFPWAEMAKHGVGIFPEITQDDIDFAKTQPDVARILEQIGYAPVGAIEFGEAKFPSSLEKLIEAFQLHFEPDVFIENKEKIGIVSEKTLAMMHAVLRIIAEK